MQIMRILPTRFLASGVNGFHGARLPDPEAKMRPASARAPFCVGLAAAFPWEETMKRSFSAGMIVLVLLAGQAIAQTLAITPEQRTQIKSYVVQQKVRPAPVKVGVAVGAILPADIELQAAPSAWGPSFGSYRFFYHDNRVVFVEPSSRKIVQIVE
jgi:Protein of unknown function (DUF1236)